ncbi:MAG: hypothetical protein LBE53_07975 [Paucimonas sp.]|jgi:Zn finger protein HypA/HybF involved in hydrogenase expression|nr:hypothetical protein [Paucimonas sp.]
MRSLSPKVWYELQSVVTLLSDKSSVMDILEVILLWLRRNYECFAVEPFSVYGFDELSHVNEKLMPVEFSTFRLGDMAHFREVILGYQAKDVEAIARFLRDTIEELITIEIDGQCPRCESHGMRIFIGKQNGLLAFQCNDCGYAHYSDGSKVEIGGLEFVSEARLRELGLI